MWMFGRSPRSSSAGSNTDITPASYAPRAPPPDSTSPTLPADFRPLSESLLATSQRYFVGLPSTPLTGICCRDHLSNRRGRGMAARTKAARKTAGKAGRAANQARQNAYVQRFVEDPELRENVRSAFDSARKAYKRMQNGKGPARALVEDKKLQKELRRTADSLQQATEQLRGKRRRSHRGRKLLMLMILGAA